METLCASRRVAPAEEYLVKYLKYIGLSIQLADFGTLHFLNPQLLLPPTTRGQLANHGRLFPACPRLACVHGRLASTAGLHPLLV